MLASLSAQDQIAAFIANAMPQAVLQFKFDSAIQDRIFLLTQKKKESLISSEECEELEKYLIYDLLIGLAKVRAYQKTNSHQN